MAKKSTTKKSSVGKTSKASVSRKSAASKSKQTSKKVSAKRPANKKTQKKAAAKNTQTAAAGLNFKRLSQTLHGLRALHILSAAVFAVLIALIYQVVDVVNRTVTIGYATPDVVEGGDVLAPAVRELWSLDVRHAVTALLGIGIVYSLTVATLGWQKYYKRAEAATSGLRWAISVVMAVVALFVVALLLGLYDLILVGVLAALLALAGYLAYRSEQTKDIREKARLFVSAVVASAVVALAAAAFVSASVIYGIHQLSLYTYALADILALAALGFGAIQLFQLRGRRGFTQSLQVERNYVTVSSLATLLFAAAFIYGFMV